MTHRDVVIIGAGPYGLSAAAHLRTIPGLDVAVFGEAMSFWERFMPAGMLLRSNWSATQIADPKRSLTLEAFQKDSGTRFSTPVPLENFVRYGMWYQRQAVPDLDRRKVLEIDSKGGAFRVRLEDGEEVSARRVVIAAGIQPFAWKPPSFAGLASSIASHASEHREFDSFKGKTVMVIGGGQSALESAALLHEAGAYVKVVCRAPKINWLGGLSSTTLHHRVGRLIPRLLYAPTDVGPAGISQLMARPEVLQKLPRLIQDKLTRRSIRPAGARWLVGRLRDVSIKLDTSVASYSVKGDRVEVRLSDGSADEIDHLLLGTGYRIDISKFPFLTSEMTAGIRQVNGYPRLEEGFETTIPGLHIIGAPAAWSYGALLRFVSGAGYASRALVRSILGNPLVRAGILLPNRESAKDPSCDRPLSAV